MNYKERLSKFRRLLEPSGDPIVDIPQLRDLSLRGIPDDNLRPLAWKLLLGYMPPEKDQWQSTLNSRREAYYDYIRDLLQAPDGDPNDHPLSVSATSKWGIFFKDNAILEQIDKDIKRTLPDIAFFQQPVRRDPSSPLSPVLKAVTLEREPRSSTDSLRLSVDQLSLDNPTLDSGEPLQVSSTKSSPLATVRPINTRRLLFRRIQHFNRNFGSDDRRNSISINVDDPQIDDYHWEVIERILFLYAKLNPGIGYCQGMNEIIGSLYYCIPKLDEKVLAQSGEVGAEPDTFWCFNNVMSEIREVFIKTSDFDEDQGIGATMKRFMGYLKTIDPELSNHLESNKVHPTYFALRWFTCMLCQEFSLPSVIRIWDSIFADCDYDNHPGFSFLHDYCCAMLLYIRRDLLNSNFAEILKMLQCFPVTDIAPILAISYLLREHRISGSNESLNELHALIDLNEHQHSNFRNPFRSKASLLRIKAVNGSSLKISSLEPDGHRSPLSIFSRFRNRSRGPTSPSEDVASLVSPKSIVSGNEARISPASSPSLASSSLHMENLVGSGAGFMKKMGKMLTPSLTGQSNAEIVNDLRDSFEIGEDE